MEAEIKASLPKASLAEVRKLPATDRRRVEEHLDEGAVRQLDAAAGLAWVPVELQAELDRGIRTSLGYDRLTRLTRDLTRSSSITPLVAPVLRGTLSVFGSGSAGR